MNAMYCILDIETTGLDPENDHLLELGMLALDKDFNVVDSFVRVLYFTKGGEKYYADSYVQEMHTKNGLWEEATRGSSRREAERDAVRFIGSNFGSTVPEMCGNSVHFDRGFLQKNMPFFEGMFHYRNIDVSTLKILAAKFGIEPAPKVGTDHRALEDCLGSRVELMYYLDKMGWRK